MALSALAGSRPWPDNGPAYDSGDFPVEGGKW
jgi:hypothetical protein